MLNIKNIRFGLETGEPLTSRQLLGWGAVGGCLYALSAVGLFEFDSVKKIFLVDNQSYTQKITVLFYCLGISVVGAIWAYTRKPLYSISSAVIWGVLATTAVDVTKHVGSQVLNDSVSAHSTQKIDNISRGPASINYPESRSGNASLQAVPSSDTGALNGENDTITPNVESESGTLDCILKALSYEVC